MTRTDPTLYSCALSQEPIFTTFTQVEALAAFVRLLRADSVQRLTGGLTMTFIFKKHFHSQNTQPKQPGRLMLHARTASILTRVILLYSLVRIRFFTVASGALV